ncbi:MAG TPA: N-acetylmuramoyl-L-alanine amidase [Hellea balneolensis]|uniref:N-acetylmuramoyl-L-alanine amidase n=1 Tax=Hellea balneolensis TaxID=287478 RepID=A0A7C5M0E4_9PROT|nr:N-acetylmuramoyl-L-alanine amidase [Hellea balneolensis]
MSKSTNTRSKTILSPSPNFDERALPVSVLVLHYTGMENAEVALERLRCPEAKVSSHYMIDEDGQVFQLVDENMRAWHAGVSSWHGVRDLNSASIGIEIVNGGHDFGLPPFPDIQIDAVMSLSKSILERHNIDKFNIVAHSDIAPARKQDPGERFPWALLAKNGIGVFPQSNTADQRNLFAKNSVDEGVRAVQTALRILGYGIEQTGVLDEGSMCVIKAFQRRYRPQKIDGLIDVQTMILLSELVGMKKKSGSVASVG